LDESWERNSEISSNGCCVPLSLFRIERGKEPLVFLSFFNGPRMPDLRASRPSETPAEGGEAEVFTSRVGRAMEMILDQGKEVNPSLPLPRGSLSPFEDASDLASP
jgi:hypothetical protein